MDEPTLDSLTYTPAKRPFNATQELVNLLYRYAPATLLSGQVVAIIVVLALFDSTNKKQLLIWLSGVTLLNLLRLGLCFLRSHSAEKFKPDFNWTSIYTILTALTGLGWALLLVIYDTELPLYSQLLILIVLVSMPVASMPNNAICLPVYYSFAAPIFVTIQVWALLIIEQLRLEFSALCIAYFIVLLVTAHAYHKNLRDALEARARNEQLIDELSQVNNQLEEFAYRDPLTGLSNRRWFQDQAEIALERCQRHQTLLAVMLIDLDNFKEINDTHGHSIGDKVLITIANRLKSALRQTDSIAHAQVDTARYGGDEFIVLLEDIKQISDMDKAAQRVVNEVREPMYSEDFVITPSCSMGIAFYPSDGDTIATLIRRADIALYRVKDTGRNDFQFFTRKN